MGAGKNKGKYPSLDTEGIIQEQILAYDKERSFEQYYQGPAFYFLARNISSHICHIQGASPVPGVGADSDAAAENLA